MHYTSKHRLWSPKRRLVRIIPKTLMKASDVMNNLLPFIAGYICGGAAGIFFMCLFQINRNERKDDEQ